MGLTIIAPIFNDVSTNSIKKFELATDGDGYLELYIDDYGKDGDVETIIVIVSSVNGLVP